MGPCMPLANMPHTIINPNSEPINSGYICSNCDHLTDAACIQMCRCMFKVKIWWCNDISSLLVWLFQANLWHRIQTHIETIQAQWKDKVKPLGLSQLGTALAIEMWVFFAMQCIFAIQLLNEMNERILEILPSLFVGKCGFWIFVRMSQWN